MHVNERSREYQRCTRCIMDTTAPNITFDDSGFCNFCTDFSERWRKVEGDYAAKREKLQELVQRIKRDGKNKPYDCIIGVSGGVDSSWVLVQAVKMGLRPLAVHMDNGWNSELAQNNIANLVRALKVDLFTYVIEWNEYRRLMQAFFDADVIDVELLYDNAMLAVNYKQAYKYNIKYILSGSNSATEGIAMPEGWNWFKYDKRNIKSIASKFKTGRLKTFPSIGLIERLFSRIVRKIQWVPFLDFMNYNKTDALECLEREFGYKRYPFKHYESIFTRFYQGYILPKKFGVDKRLLHYSTLVMSGQMQRHSALDAMNEITYESDEQLSADIEYFLKKMRWSREDLEDYLNRPGVPHDNYSTEWPLLQFLIKLRGVIKLKHRGLLK